MRHLPNLQSLSAVELTEILNKAAEIKANPADFYNLLHRKSLAMLFQKTSTRTRVSFEAAMTELGGHAIFIDWATSNFVLSGIEHETEYLSRNVSCIMARLLYNEDLTSVMGASQVPVINGCDEKFHPCQAMTDVLSMIEHFDGDISDARLTYLGVQNNVSNSLVTICHKLGINLTLATPSAVDNGESEDAFVQDLIKSSHVISHTTDPKAAVQGTDFVYTDTWVDMQYFNNPDHKEENDQKLKEMMPYQINSDLLKGLDCKIMHDMPIHDGFEISTEMTKDPRAIMYQQAENRLHAQKGILWWLYQESGQLDNN
jgi:ornithine carbamoyltransferase